MKSHVHLLFSTSGFDYFQDKLALKRKYPGYTFPGKLIVKHKLRKAMPQRKLPIKSMLHWILVDYLISTYNEIQFKKSKLSKQQTE